VAAESHFSRNVAGTSRQIWTVHPILDPHHFVITPSRRVHRYCRNMNQTTSPVDALSLAGAFIGNTLRLSFYAITHDEMLLALPTAWITNTNNETRTLVTTDMLKLADLPNYTLAAIPGFVIMCCVEYLVGLCRGKQIYRINDGLMSFMLGAVMMVFKCLVSPTIGISLYCYIWSHYGFQQLIPLHSMFHYVGLLLAGDCGYYWFHRTAHQYHLSWSAHQVHHSGEDYNLATALRQGAVQWATSWPFYLMLAFFFHPALFVLHSALNTLGQFWIHTTVIGHVGVLEYILNTPSHHRMHHRPPGNCNYAGVLIVWDRMFGTFVAEKKQMNYYGLAKQYNTFDPAWANVEHIKRQLSVVSKRKNTHICSYATQFCRKRVHHPLVFQPMNLFNTIHPNPSVLWTLPQGEPKRKKLHSVRTNACLTVYIVLQFIFTLGLSIGTLMAAKHFTTAERVVVCATLIASFSSYGRLLDGTYVGLTMETVRCVCLGIVGTMHLFQPQKLSTLPDWVPLASQIHCGVWLSVLLIVTYSWNNGTTAEIQNKQKKQ
jgi:sterol desaturase/sphingolipid hydroxylase (fatty acid hydroxylase superfamily)